VAATFAVSLLVTGLLTAGCGGQSDSTESRSKDVSCTVAKVRHEEIPEMVTATGSLQADKSIMVSTRMMGWVRRIHVVEGQAVTQGEPLVDIDATDLKAKQAQAEAGIAEAEAVLANAAQMASRFERLYAEKSVSKQQLDDVLTGRDRAAAGVKMAKAALAEVKVHLSYLNITAPADGVVARKMVEEGDMANPGMPLISLEQTGRVKVVAHLGEKDVSEVQVGDLARINISSLANATYEATVSRVIPSANPGSRTYDVETYLDNSNGRLRSGMFARVSIPVGSRRAVLVPDDAIIRRGQLTGVWVVGSEDRIGLRWVRLGRPQGTDVEVLSGLEGNETIVLSSEQPIVEGDRAVR